MKQRLKDETYLEDGDYKIDGIIDALVVGFENRTKRHLNVTKIVPTTIIEVQGLQKNVQKRFLKNKVQMHQ